jgi:hypothetical protein
VVPPASSATGGSVRAIRQIEEAPRADAIERRLEWPLLVEAMLALPGEIDQRATHDARVELLCQIYGIGRYLGMMIVAELGEERGEESRDVRPVADRAM